MGTFSQKVTISLHTIENAAFGASEIDTPIEDQKWSGRSVERIRASDRGCSIGVFEIATKITSAGESHSKNATVN